MTCITLVWVFLFGLTLGSFLNVCVYRLPREYSIVTPRSSCPMCGEMIAWYDNIPVLSYLFLLGKCRHCKIVISPRYAIVELLTGLLFVLCYKVLVIDLGEGFGVYGWSILLTAGLIVATFVDFEFRIIPNEISLPGMVIGVLACVLCPRLQPDVRAAYGKNGVEVAGIESQQAARCFLAQHQERGPRWWHSLSCRDCRTRLALKRNPAWPFRRERGLTGNLRLDAGIASILGLIIGAGIVLATAILGRMAFKKEAMGFGDVKLMGLVGAFVGWQLVVVAFFIAPFFALLMGIPVYVCRKQHVIPFGPFLSAAAVLCMLCPGPFLSIIDGYLALIFQATHLVQ